MNPFVTIPFFRIIIPFIAGIASAIFLHVHFPQWLSFLLLLPVAFSLTGKSTLHRQITMFCADIFLFVFAVNLVAITDDYQQPNHFRNHLRNKEAFTFTAVLSDLPIVRSKSVKCQVQIRDIVYDSLVQPVFGKSILYLADTSQAKNLHAGQTILVKAKFNVVPGPMNPDEFDYHTYLYRKHIYHTAFVQKACFTVLNDIPEKESLWLTALKIKAKVLAALRQSKLNPQSAAICAALLTGYDDEIDKTVIDAFAHSGTLHVLSVSGLHTGLIYAALSFLFSLVDRKKKYKIIQFVLITILLWFFALITGFAPPVLRAVIMFNFLGLGKLFFRSGYRNQMNILIFSAFLILLADPWILTDLGFLLSYFAMFGLFYFQPALAALISTENVFIKSTWSSISASFAATISTLPITLLFFHQFPVWFFICNIIVVPATFLILFISIGVLFQLDFASGIINFIVDWLIKFINLFNSDSVGYIEGIDFTVQDAFFLATLTILLSLAIQSRSFKLLRLSMLCLIVWQLASIVTSFETKKTAEFCVYHIRKSSASNIKSGNNLILQMCNSNAYGYSLRSHIVTMNYIKKEIKTFNYAICGDTRILYMSKPGYSFATVDPQITHLVLSNNYRPDKNLLGDLKSLKWVICDASNSLSSLRHTEKLCRTFALNFYPLADSGAFVARLGQYQENETKNRR